MPRNALSDAEVDSVRTRLCVAALAMVRDDGVDAVTFRSLADVLGVSHTLPYRYFANKEALLASVRLLCFEQFERFISQRESSAASDVEGVFAVMDAYMDFVLRHPVEYSLIFVTAQPPPQRYPALLAARRRLFEYCVQLVQRCVDEGAVGGDARLLTHSVWGSVHGLLTLHVANQLVHGCRIEDLVRPTILRILGLSDTAPGRVRQSLSVRDRT